MFVRRAFPAIDLTIQTFIERQFRTSRIRFHVSIEFEAKVFIQSEILAKMRTDARQCNHLALKRRGKRNAYKSISGETQRFLFESILPVIIRPEIQALNETRTYKLIRKEHRSDRKLSPYFI